MNSVGVFLRNLVVVAVIAIGSYFGLGLMLPHAAPPPAIAGRSAEQILAEAIAEKPAPPPPSASRDAPAATSDIAATPAPAPVATDAPAAVASAAAVKSAVEANPKVAATATAHTAPAIDHHQPRSLSPRPSAYDSINPWWTHANGALQVSFVGQAMSDRVLAVLFGSDIDAAAAAPHLHLFDANGHAVNAQWHAGKNHRLLVSIRLAPGRYVLSLDAALADTQGQTLGTELQGPAYIQTADQAADQPKDQSKDRPGDQPTKAKGE